MKKTMLLAIMAGAMLAGCVKNEEVVQPDGSPEPITFDAPVVSVPTKATEIANNYPKDKNFAVYAIHSLDEFTHFSEGKLYMENVTCTHHSSATEPTDYWAPSDQAYYWPKNGYLTFAAYAPAMPIPDEVPYFDSPVEWNDQGFTFKDFKVNDDPTKQIDLLYSGRVYDQTKNNMGKDNPYDGIQIPFKHALSSIVFTAKADVSSGITIKITEITVHNVVNKGTFEQKLHYRPAPSDSEKGEETANPRWTISTLPGDAAAPYTVFRGEGDDAKTLSADVVYFGGEKSATNGTRKSDLILIPQALTGQKNEEGSVVKYDVVVDIKYTIYDDNGTPNDTNDDLPPNEQSPRFKLAVGETSEWEMGKRYTYNIVIGAHKIYFNPTVTPWEDKTGIEL